jgi:hypothetical protein
VIGRVLVCGLFVASVGTTRAAAAEVCVVCSSPDATYRCTVDEASLIARYRSGDRVLQLLCISELAKAGGHTKCRVSRDPTGFCAGEARTIGPALEAALAHGSSDAPPGPVDGHEAAPAPVQGGPPRTVEELARRTTQASSEQLRKAGEVMTDSASSAASRLEKAGDAIGGAVRKTWRCATSLFTQC